MYSLDNVSVRIDSNTILRDLSISIEVNKITTLLGHNGCGKSTLIKLLGRQFEPSKGSIELDGQPLSKYSSRQLAQKVAYLPQQPPFTDGITVRELVYFGRYPWRGALGRFTDQDHEIVENCIERTDLGGLSDRFVATLSGGERQRAWVAMLLAQTTEVVLLDEPISALDVAHQLELIQLIAELNRDYELTVVMVLHDVNLAARFSDEIIAIHGGELLFKDLPEKIMKQDRLKEIYGLNLGLFKHPGSDRITTYLP